MFDKPHEVRKEIIKAVNKSFEIFIFGFLRLTKIIKLNCEIIHYYLFLFLKIIEFTLVITLFSK